MDFKNLAESIMFNHMTHTELEKHFEYKKGKDRDHLDRAIKRGIKNGNYKTEREIEGIEAQLKKILVQKVTP